MRFLKYITRRRLTLLDVTCVIATFHLAAAFGNLCGLAVLPLLVLSAAVEMWVQGK